MQMRRDFGRAGRGEMGDAAEEITIGSRRGEGREFPEEMGWRNLWLVRWARAKIYNPLMAILRRYPFTSLQ